ncbi:invasion associated locus B family protein [Halomonas salinarum]|uniref:invasion associated locus B family protein n=1 Tax=Halomonas salinarum TaxID=1158993 RepID=UPI001438A14F|nr:invasion associated locus B family protein [Halomonas salinarum]
MSSFFTRRLCMTGLLSLLAFAPHALAQQGSMGQPGADITTEQFSDWEVVCPSEARQGNCTMNQVVSNAESNQPLMRVVVAYPPQLEGSPAMTILLPLGVRLAPGLQLSAGSVQPAQFPYQVCQQQGCRADLPLEPSMFQALRAGSSATVSFVDPRGNRRDLDISLMGFTDASQAIAP